MEFEDRLHSRNCLRVNSSFSHALEIFYDKGSLNLQAFEAVYNLAGPYDSASYWNAFPITSRQGNNFSIALEISKNIENGKKIFLPYWVFDPHGALIFLQDALLSKIINFKFNMMLPTEQYKNLFYIDISPIKESDVDNIFIESQYEKISNAILCLYNNIKDNESDIVNELYYEINQWKDEFYSLKKLYTLLSEKNKYLENNLNKYKNEYLLNKKELRIKKYYKSIKEKIKKCI